MKLHWMAGLLTLVLFYSCGNKKQPAQAANVQPKTEVAAPAQAAPPPGKKVYDQYCLACHQADGAGIRAMHPPLVNSKTVNGDPEKLIRIVLEGMSGKLEIDGVVYNGLMPPHNHLTNSQVADVLTYIRQNFHNSSPEITAEEVKKLR